MIKLSESKSSRERQEYVGSGAWWNDNLSFDHNLEIISADACFKTKQLLESFLKNRQRVKNKGQKQTNIKILCANLIISTKEVVNIFDSRYAGKPIAVSMNRNDYRSQDRYIQTNYSCLKEIIDYLVSQGYIMLKKGFRNKTGGRMTRICPTAKFKEYFDPCDEIEYTPLELVNLRDRNKNNLPYKDTPQTTKLRENLRDINTVNRKAIVQLKTSRGFTRLSTDLHAVFTEDFQQNGRLYTSRSGYQSLSEEERKDIMINHKETVELDFSGMAIKLLYATAKNQQYEADPYEKCLQALQTHPRANGALQTKTKQLRIIAKKCLLAMLNADSSVSAVSAGNNGLRKEKNRHLKEALDECKLVGENISRRITIKMLHRLLKLSHKDIAEYFYTEIGLKLMHLDSKIALDVLRHFTDQGIPCLAIHDSFIVQKEYEAELRTVMDNAYRLHSGGYSCAIK